MRDITAIPPVAAARRIVYGEDPNQFFDLFQAPQSAGATLLNIHGGFWRAKYDLGHASHFCDALSKTGIDVLNVEYRRVGNPGGGWPGTIEDLRLALEAIRDQFPSKPLILAGHSAGGHLALRLACEEIAIAGVVALAPVAVLREAYDLHLSNDAVVEFLGGTPAQMPEIYGDACPSMHPLRSSAILIHGVADDVVPVSISRNYLSARVDDDVRLLELPSTSHMDLVDPGSQAFDTVAGAIHELLR